MMEFQFLSASAINLAINLTYSILALIISVYALLWVDKKVLKNVNLEEEIKNGNIAVAIFASAILIFVAIVIVFGFRA